MDELTRVEAQIEAVSTKIEVLYALKSLKRAGKSTFDADQEEELQYWKKEKEALRKKEEDLRKEKEDLREKELLLLKKSITESGKLIYSFRYKILSGTD